MIIALINNKGGVGKTTTAVSLAAALAAPARRVLLVDLDSQASASLSLGVARPDLKPSSADVMFRDRPIAETIRGTHVEGLDLLTGSQELCNADDVISSTKARPEQLREALHSVRDRYGYIFIDCPPSLSQLALAALLAADGYVVPITPQYLAVGGLASLIEAVNQVRQSGLSRVAELTGILLTMVDYRNRSTGEMVARLRASLKEKVFATEIRVNVRLAEAPAAGETIFEHDNSSTGAKAYRALAAELEERCRAYQEQGAPAAADAEQPREAQPATQGIC